jgi:hypothetical protein
LTTTLVGEARNGSGQTVSHDPRGVRIGHSAPTRAKGLIVNAHSPGNDKCHRARGAPEAVAWLAAVWPGGLQLLKVILHAPAICRSVGKYDDDMYRR